MLLSSILVQLAQTAVEAQRLDGSMPEGHNGPWNHVDTSVRTTAHWAIAFNKVFELTGDGKWKSACLKCGDYLTSAAARPLDASFYCRVDHKNPERRNNGLVGQAWALEALVELGRKHEREEYLKVATDVVDRHRYSYELHGWKNLLVDGREGAFDRTVNQQIWFSQMASRLSDLSPQARDASRDFFSHLHRHIAYHRNGTIRHVTDGTQRGLSRLKRPLYGVLFGASCEDKAELLAVGYQSFVLMAIFGYLQETRTDRQIYPFLEPALQFSLDKANEQEYRDNAYCYGYNVTGVELAYVAETLGDFDAAAWWLQRQFEWTSEPGGRFLSKNVSDLVVVPSRIYEIYRLKKDYEINVSMDSYRGPN